jgi:hypothetical protein
LGKQYNLKVLKDLKDLKDRSRGRRGAGRYNPTPETPNPTPRVGANAGGLTPTHWGKPLHMTELTGVGDNGGGC